MTYKFIYPAVILNIRDVCNRYLVGNATIDEFQRMMLIGEAEILAYEEKDIREFLTDVESRIELVRFSVDDDKKFDETKKIANYVLKWLEKRTYGDTV